MSDKHTLSIDYQIAQARLVKKLTAENSQLRAKSNQLLKELETLKKNKHDNSDVLS